MLQPVFFMLTTELNKYIVLSMNNEEIAKTLGKSRQMLEATIGGKRNFSYKAAKKASEVIGGTVDIWQDKDYSQMRLSLFEAFKKKTGG